MMGQQKQVAKYGDHASVIAANVVTLLKGKQPSALYRGAYELISISNGKVSGLDVVILVNVAVAHGPYSKQEVRIGRSSGGRHLETGCPKP